VITLFSFDSRWRCGKNDFLAAYAWLLVGRSHEGSFDQMFGEEPDLLFVCPHDTAHDEVVGAVVSRGRSRTGK